jgi:hypothetical protein
MDLATMIVTVYCWVTDTLKQILGGKRLRQRGFEPMLSDSEVITMEVVGEFLSIDQDKKIWSYFRRHWAHFFPALEALHRTTFVRQAAGLWAMKEALWKRLIEQTRRWEDVGMLDSLPIHVCQFARAKRHRRFKGIAAFGRDELIRQTFYGFRCHVQVQWPGVISKIQLAPGNNVDRHLTPEMAEGFQGLLLGDRAFHQPDEQQRLRQEGCVLFTPGHPRHPDPCWTRRFTYIRRRIETVFGQLVERFHLKRVWAQDLWHFSSRLLRKVLSHTLGVFLNQQQYPDRSPLELDALLPA